MTGAVAFRYDHASGTVVDGDRVVARLEAPYRDDRRTGQAMAVAPLLVERLVSVWGMAKSALEAEEGHHVDNLLAMIERQCRRGVGEALGLAPEPGLEEDHP